MPGSPLPSPSCCCSTQTRRKAAMAIFQRYQAAKQLAVLAALAAVVCLPGEY